MDNGRADRGGGIDGRIDAMSDAIALRQRQIESERRVESIDDNVAAATESMSELDTRRTGFRETAMRFLSDLADLAKSYREWLPPRQTGTSKRSRSCCRSCWPPP